MTDPFVCHELQHITKCLRCLCTSADGSPSQQQQLASHAWFRSSPHSDGAHSAAHLTSSESSREASFTQQQSQTALLATAHLHSQQKPALPVSPQASQQHSAARAEQLHAAVPENSDTRLQTRNAVLDGGQPLESGVAQDGSGQYSAPDAAASAPMQPQELTQTCAQTGTCKGERVATQLSDAVSVTHQQVATHLSDAVESTVTEQHALVDHLQSDTSQVQPLGSSPRQSAIHKLRSISVKHLFGIKHMTNETPAAVGPVAGQSTGVQVLDISAVPAPAVLPDRWPTSHTDRAPACRSTAGTGLLSPRRSTSLAKLRSQSLAKGPLYPQAQSAWLSPSTCQSHNNEADPAALPSLLGVSLPQTSNADMKPASVSHTYVQEKPDICTASAAPAETQSACGCHAAVDAAVDVADISLVMQDVDNASAAADALQQKEGACLTTSVRVSISTDGQRASVSLQVTDADSVGASTSQMPVTDAQHSAVKLSETPQHSSGSAQAEHQRWTAAHLPHAAAVLGDDVQLMKQQSCIPNADRPMTSQQHSQQLTEADAPVHVGFTAAADKQISAARQLEEHLQPEAEAEGNVSQPLTGNSLGRKGKSGQGFLGGFKSWLYKSRSQSVQQYLVGKHAISADCTQITVHWGHPILSSQSANMQFGSYE